MPLSSRTFVKFSHDQAVLEFGASDRLYHTDHHQRWSAHTIFDLNSATTVHKKNNRSKRDVKAFLYKYSKHIYLFIVVALLSATVYFGDLNNFLHNIGWWQTKKSTTTTTTHHVSPSPKVYPKLSTPSLVDSVTRETANTIISTATETSHFTKHSLILMFLLVFALLAAQLFLARHQSPGHDGSCRNRSNKRRRKQKRKKKPKTVTSTTDSNRSSRSSAESDVRATLPGGGHAPDLILVDHTTHTAPLRFTGQIKKLLAKDKAKKAKFEKRPKSKKSIKTKKTKAKEDRDKSTKRSKKTAKVRPIISSMI